MRSFKLANKVQQGDDRQSKIDSHDLDEKVTVSQHKQLQNLKQPQTTLTNQNNFLIDEESNTELNLTMGALSQRTIFQAQGGFSTNRDRTYSEEIMQKQCVKPTMPLVYSGVVGMNKLMNADDIKKHYEIQIK